jgi:hypothetical protein
MLLLHIYPELPLLRVKQRQIPLTILVPFHRYSMLIVLNVLYSEEQY